MIFEIDGFLPLIDLPLIDLQLIGSCNRLGFCKPVVFAID
jgi:hypothetical protein